MTSLPKTFTLAHISSAGGILLTLAVILLTALSSLSQAATKLTNPDQVKECDFSKSNHWYKTPYSKLPSSVENNKHTGSPEFCEFYQFAQDYFLYLVSPSSSKSLANWQDSSQYPLLETSGTDSCDKQAPANAFNIRSIKSKNDTSRFVIPERIDQAGENVHAIYDQNGNVIFYEVRFSMNLCDYEKIQQKDNFPGKTTELKMAWRILEKGAKGNDDFYQMDATISGIDYTLGLVGWHIVVAADNHPEMVWLTLDHTSNAVECANIGTGQVEHDFTSKACATNDSNCININETLDASVITLPEGTKPNDICQAFRYGTIEGQSTNSNDWLNIALIKKLNHELQNNIFSASGLPAGLDVWKNYQVTGALWISNIGLDSEVTKNQRGSLLLANTVMETQFQGTTEQPDTAHNCFHCHEYSAKESNTRDRAGLSHIFDNIISGQQCHDETSSVVINSQAQAKQQCPKTCAAKNLNWNKQWTNQDAKTGKQLPMTVCGCCPK